MTRLEPDQVVVYIPRYYKGRIQGWKKRLFPPSGVPLINMLINTGEIENIDLDSPDAPLILAKYAEKLNRAIDNGGSVIDTLEGEKTDAVKLDDDSVKASLNQELDKNIN